jgi:hypothetical protein
MRNNKPASNRPHPTIGELLLYEDAEMDPLRAKLVEDHLAACEKCAQDCAELSRSILSLTALFHSLRMPGPQASPAVLARRVVELADRSRDRRRLWPDASRIFALLSGRRLAFAGVFLGAVVVCALLFQTSQRAARASEILTRSIVASDSIGKSHKVLHQKVRLRQGNRVVEKGIFRGVPYQTGDAPVSDAALEETLRLAAVDWNDPLNPRDFARWRDAQKGSSDQISESTGTVTITTAARDSLISAASLTLSRSDWHPVARRIDLKAQPPVEITEIGSELMDADSVALARIPPNDLTASDGSPLLRAPSSLEMEESELRLRETLASLGLDTTAAPVIWRTRDNVHFRIYSTSSEDVEKLRAAIRDVPFIIEGGQAPTSAFGAAPAPLNREVESGAPYAGALEKSLGGLEQANQYLTSVQDRYRRAFAHSAVVSALSARYPAGYSMPDPLVTRLELLVAGHVTAQRREVLAYLEALSTGLELLDARVASAGQESASDATCGSWQDRAQLAATELRELNLSFLRLFVADKAESALPQTPEARLAQCERLKTSLARRLTSLCAARQ